MTRLGPLMAVPALAGALATGLVVSAEDAGNPVLLIPGWTRNTFPRWSPDGRAILYQHQVGFGWETWS